MATSPKNRSMRRLTTISSSNFGGGPDANGEDGAAATTLTDVLRRQQANRRTVIVNDYQGSNADDTTLVISGSALGKLSQEDIADIEGIWVETSRRARRVEEAKSLTKEQFVKVMWEPLVRTGAYTAEGHRNMASVLGSPTSDKLSDDDEDTSRKWPKHGGERTAEQQRALDLLRGTHGGQTMSSGGNDLLVYVSDLFESIDVQSKGYISWDQFVTYIIERIFFHNITKAEDGPLASLLSIRADSHATSSAAGGSLLYRGEFSYAYPPQTPHWTHTLKYFNDWDAVVALDNKTAVVTMAEDMVSARKDRDTNLLNIGDVTRAEISGSSYAKNGAQYFQHGGMVNACEYMHSLSLFITAATELQQVRLWSVHMRKELRFMEQCAVNVPGNSSITAIKASERLLYQRDALRLLLGTRSGHLVTLSMPNLNDGVKRLDDFDAAPPVHLHQDGITDMLVLPRTGRVVTSGMDGQIISHELGDTELRSKCSYVGHTRGVCSLAYCPGYEIFVSGGFEYQALCWAENLPSSPAFPLIDTVQPHLAPVTNVIAVENAPHVYTCDLDGVIKLFDVRTLKVIGSWGAFDSGRVPTSVMNDVHAGGARGVSRSGNIGAVCYTGSKTRTLLLGAKKVFRFHTETRSVDAERAHDIGEPLVSVDVGCRHLITCTTRSVRQWSMEEGTVNKTHHTERYRSAAATIAVADDLSGKVIVGFADGSICAFVAATGILIRRYCEFHRHAITAIALDKINGVLVTACKLGKVAFWRDADIVTCPTGLEDHLKYVHGYYTPVQEHVRRIIPSLMDNMGLRDAIEFDDREGSVREARLQRWVVHRWIRFMNNRNGTHDAGANETALAITEPFGSISLLHPSRHMEVDGRAMRALILSSKATCRIIDYSKSVAVTHRLFHGVARQLTAATLLKGSNLVATTDRVGQLFLWLVPPDGASIILSAWFNKCLVKSYSHPLKEFQERRSSMEEARERDMAEIRDAITNKDQEIDEEFEMVNDEDDVNGVHQDPLEAVPMVTSVVFDPIRFALITGDDVGYVSVWEVEPVFTGVCDWRSALKRSLPSGTPPRWIHAWRAHEVAVQVVTLMPHTMYAVVTGASDNTVSLWTIDGSYLSGLRQGPVVDRMWRFPDLKRERSALQRLRFEKLQAAIKSGEVAAMNKSTFGSIAEVSTKLLRKLQQYKRGAGSFRPNRANFKHRQSTYAERREDAVAMRAAVLSQLGRKKVSVSFGSFTGQQMRAKKSSGSLNQQYSFGSPEDSPFSGSSLVSPANQPFTNKLHEQSEYGTWAETPAAGKYAPPKAYGSTTMPRATSISSSPPPTPSPLHGKSKVFGDDAAFGTVVKEDHGCDTPMESDFIDKAFAGEEELERVKAARAPPPKVRIESGAPEIPSVRELHEELQASTVKNDGPMVLGRKKNETLLYAGALIREVKERYGAIYQEAEEVLPCRDRRDFNTVLAREQLGLEEREHHDEVVANMSVRSRMRLKSQLLPADSREVMVMKSQFRKAYTPQTDKTALKKRVVLAGEMSLGGINSVSIRTNIKLDHDGRGKPPVGTPPRGDQNQEHTQDGSSSTAVAPTIVHQQQSSTASSASLIASPITKSTAPLDAPVQDVVRRAQFVPDSSSFMRVSTPSLGPRKVGDSQSRQRQKQATIATTPQPKKNLERSDDDDDPFPMPQAGDDALLSSIGSRHEPTFSDMSLTRDLTHSGTATRSDTALREAMGLLVGGGNPNPKHHLMHPAKKNRHLAPIHNVDSQGSSGGNNAGTVDPRAMQQNVQRVQHGVETLVRGGGSQHRATGRGNGNTSLSRSAGGRNTANSLLSPPRCRSTPPTLATANAKPLSVSKSSRAATPSTLLKPLGRNTDTGAATLVTNRSGLQLSGSNRPNTRGY